MGIMETNSEKYIQKFPKKLRPILEKLLFDGVGVCNLSPKLIKNENNNNGQLERLRFVLEVPYAGKCLNWEVIFDDEDENFAPDFNFLNDHFLSEPDVDVIERHVPSLAGWDPKNGRCMVKVVNEFLTLYRKYQVEKLLDTKFQRQMVDYNLLTGDVGVDAETIEVYVDGQDNVHFLIAIEIDNEEFPPYMQQNNTMELLNPRDDFAILKVSFMNNRVTTAVQLSPRLESVIGASSQLQIPAFHKESGLIEYVPAISKLIQGKMQTVTKNFKLRKEYIGTMLAYQGNSIIEYDGIMFYKVTLLLRVEDVSAVVIISLSKNFPQEAPKIKLVSIQYEMNDTHLTKEYTKYPYEATSCPEAIVQKTLRFLSDAIKEFKREETQ